MIAIFGNGFKTRLGVIRTSVESSCSDATSCDDNYIKTQGHTIHLQLFEIENEWLDKEVRIETSRGWKRYIKRINETPETLNISCKLLHPTKDTSFSNNSGQCLDAIEIEDTADVLHIGTEDGELMQTRAEISD